MSEPLEPAEASLRSFEARLHSLMPLPIASSTLNEGELLYRCGWEAALANASSETPVHRGKLWRIFAGGTATGLTAACLGLWCFSWFSAELANDPKPLIAAHVTEPIDAPQVDAPRFEAVESVDLDASDLFARLLAWSRTRFGPAEELAISRAPVAAESLSQVAKRSWSQILSESDIPAGMPFSERQPKSKPLGELLRELVRPNEIL